jgi:hypothetical protein
MRVEQPGEGVGREVWQQVAGGDAHARDRVGKLLQETPRVERGERGIRLGHRRVNLCDQLRARHVALRELGRAIAHVAAAAKACAHEMPQVARQVQRKRAAAVGEARHLAPRAGVVGVQVELAAQRAQVAPQDRTDPTHQRGPVELRHRHQGALGDVMCRFRATLLKTAQRDVAVPHLAGPIRDRAKSTLASEIRWI